ncbi:YolD-like family protein [Cytobacillus praedii]|uniref:YolD-like family protein n=1 Tax=Cytobacillus praedii TaxID=1742358 RepID=UPI002E21440A|nr:YolD-like family protein [Cytobacillus praedii]
MSVNKLSKGHNLRWESSRMMLPEHVEQFIQYRNSSGKISKPALDEQRLEEINDILRIAIEDYTLVYLDVYNEGAIKTIMCYVNKIDQYLRELRISIENRFEKVKLENVVDIRIV